MRSHTVDVKYHHMTDHLSRLLLTTPQKAEEKETVKTYAKWAGSAPKSKKRKCGKPTESHETWKSGELMLCSRLKYDQNVLFQMLILVITDHFGIIFTVECLAKKVKEKSAFGV